MAKSIVLAWTNPIDEASVIQRTTPIQGPKFPGVWEDSSHEHRDFLDIRSDR